MGYRCHEFKIRVSLTILMLDLVVDNYPEALLLAAFANSAVHCTLEYGRAGRFVIS